MTESRKRTLESRAVSGQRRVGVVHVLLYGGPVSLPWRSRQDLLAEFRHLDSGQALRDAFDSGQALLDAFDLRHALLDAFESGGASRVVALTREQKVESLEVIESWSMRVPDHDLPEGILELRAALADDVGRRR